MSFRSMERWLLIWVQLFRTYGESPSKEVSEDFIGKWREKQADMISSLQNFEI
jgi:beta-phosphoglucomutase-like phosphatase (HAD superfamily)